jgi:dsDNA-specific endonuclease/ATPase MutS2
VGEIVGILVVDLNTVTSDGASLGSISDAFLNHRDLAGELFDALTLYVGGLHAQAEKLREQFAQVSQEATDSLHQIDALKQQALADSQKSQADLNELRQKGASDLEQASRGFQQALQNAVDQCNFQLKQASDAIAASSAEADKQKNLASHHWDLSQTLMAGADSAAAVAAINEINRINLIGKHAEITAQLAALSPQTQTLGN